MGDKLREMVEDESYDRFTFEEKMEMLIDAEAAARRERKVAKLVKDARFKDPSGYCPDSCANSSRRLPAVGMVTRPAATRPDTASIPTRCRPRT